MVPDLSTSMEAKILSAIAIFFEVGFLLRFRKLDASARSRDLLADLNESDTS